MSLTTSGRIWDAATAPELARLSLSYEVAWRSARAAGCRPDPRAYLPPDPRARPAALLALLRTDLGLRWEARDPVRVEWYRERYPELGDEALVALLYEEFCLREEAGAAPDRAESEARFPRLADAFQKVLEIHDLVGSGRSTVARMSGPPVVPFPEVGRTIAGFRLVEELGRGAFARVFRAEERQLADRSVALKVARAGSREPQTLARLQHTHIVPVYSYRTDTVSGLHLLCMPYLGRVTLAQVLADLTTRAPRTGADLTAALDRLQPPAGAAALERPVGRLALAQRSYGRAIAWWGARLAEALQHAHDRGVLHRDVKPSNVLVTDDGMPMLLDFNLAREPWLDAPEVAPAVLGGTLAYMAPEHLAALAAGDASDQRVDRRADVFALGVVLFESLLPGSRRFPGPGGAVSVAEALWRAIEDRRGETPGLQSRRPEVPPELEAVVRKCLEADPDDRYASAADLAADLQAVADDQPLRFARAPIAGRVRGWARRHRRRLLVAAPLLAALTVLALTTALAQVARVRREGEIHQWISEGRHSVQADQLDLAADEFRTAAQLAGAGLWLQPLRTEALGLFDQARRTKHARDQADAFFATADPLRLGLLGFEGDATTAARKVEAALARFSVPDDLDWARRPDFGLLDDPRRARLRTEVNELLFLWVVALNHAGSGDAALARQSVRICDAALAFATPAGPWRALRARSAGRSPTVTVADQPARETSARVCFQWGLLRSLEGRDAAAIAWLERATRLDPNDYWSQFSLAFLHSHAGQGRWERDRYHLQKAVEHYGVAIALRPVAPEARFNRALLERSRENWDQALEDLNRASETARADLLLQIRLERGTIRQVLGNLSGARADDDVVIAAGAGSPFARAARLNRAKLDLDVGGLEKARAEYDALLTEDSRDGSARLGRALLELRSGQAARAEADLSRLLRDHPEHAVEVFGHRALAWLALGRTLEAEADAANAFRRQPNPRHERLRVRTLLALGRDGDGDLLGLESPDDLDALPHRGPALASDLRALAERLRLRAEQGGPAAYRARRARAVVLSVLGDPDAEAEAGRAMALAPLAADACLCRARIRRRSGDCAGGRADVEAGLVLEPNDPRLLEFRGVLRIEAGQYRAALLDFDQAILRGVRESVRGPRAVALVAIGQTEAAFEDWSLALKYDPDDLRACLGRASAFRRLGRWDQALADLERAVDLAGDDPGRLARTTLAYAACLSGRPDRLTRVFSLTRRACASWAERRRD